MSEAPREWNATSYHQVSAPQTSWGHKVLGRLTLEGDERVIDLGCGSGRLTSALAERVPRGHVVALDRSWNMLIVARTNLRPAFGPRVSFVQAALPQVPLAGYADVVFSTATFHWIGDHPALFANIHRALAPGGRLHAQCGGGPNLAAAHALAEQVMHEAPFAPYFADWTGVWQFASAEATTARLADAGFVDIDAHLEAAPTTLASAADYRAFVTTVIYRPHLAALPDGLHGRFIDAVTARAAATAPPFTLDYWRLNMTARHP
ncbi:MAG: methyltransferase domain-containing protein [Acidobacteria bacterium]|nr:methyltransferase domain-containing protein [Acidobacteriota bacterium]